MPICEAIQEKRLLAFHYGDDDFIVVEPHCYGMTPSGGEILRAYQVSGDRTGWRDFTVFKMHQVRVLNDLFARPRPGYEKSPNIFQSVFCQL